MNCFVSFVLCNESYVTVFLQNVSVEYVEESGAQFHFQEVFMARLFSEIEYVVFICLHDDYADGIHEQMLSRHIFIPYKHFVICPTWEYFRNK